MSVKHNLEQWIAQLDYDDTCDISDRQVSELIRNYAALEDKCAALAAENAGLKSMSDDRRTFIMNGVQLGYIKVPKVETDQALETIRIAVSPQEPTPATDAFLAEMRAQGVAMVIAYHRERAEALHHVDRNNAIRHSMAALDASDVAAKLRQDANTAELVAAGIITKVGE